MKDLALAYAHAGYRVLCTYGLTYEEDTGEWTCSCPAPHDQRYRHGKHPLFGSHGVNDATTDPAVIEAWPENIALNLALALTDTLVAIDIDDPAIAVALLDPEFGLRDVATVSTTGRGLHLWLACAPTVSGILKRKDTTERIGELRASGSYCVIPPSRHITGRQYAWLGPNLLEHGPTTTTSDGWAYVRELLGHIGIQLVDRRDVTSHPLRDVGIVPITELPYRTDNTRLLALLSPVHPVQDRSAALFHLACELIRDARGHNVEIDTATIAGVVKQTDRTRQNPKGPKFAWRDNADDCYWDLAIEAQRSVEGDAPPASLSTPAIVASDPIVTDAEGSHDEQDSDKPPQQMHGTYYYDEQAGFVDNSNPRRPTRLANFETLLFERVLYHSDEYEKPSEGYWGYKARRGGEEYTFQVAPDEYEKPSGVVAKARRKLPPHFVIENKRSSDWEAAVKLYSPPVEPRNAYAMTGWIPKRDAFLLPGLPGAIVPDGYDPSMTFEAAPGTPDEIALPRTIAYDVHLAEVARGLFTAAPPRIIMPLMAQILAAPLVSIGFKHMTIVHLHGSSNSFKTSLATSAFSFYGYAEQKAAIGIHSWSADTAGVLRELPYYYRDLPVLFDDYKEGTHSAQQITSLVQSFGDKQGRGRLSLSRTPQKAKEPRGLIISTGEDVWEDQRSTNTRSLFVSVDGIEQDRIFNLTTLATTGQLGALGVSWIRWLTKQGRERLRVQLKQAEERTRPAIEQIIGNENPRIISSFTALYVVSLLFRRFLREEVPGFAVEYDELRAAGWQHQLNASKEQAEQALAASPLTKLLTALSEGVRFGKCHFQPRLKGGEYLGTPGSEPVGLVEDGFIFLLRETTFGWYSEEKRRQGREVGFGWKQIQSEAKTRFGVEQRVEYAYGLAQRERMLRIPLAAVLDATTPENVTSETSDAKEGDIDA